LPFGNHHGASLRVASGGTEGSRGVTGTSLWQELATEFEVVEAEREVELVCELRASAGDVWFDRDSLKLVRVFNSPTTGTLSNPIKPMRDIGSDTAVFQQQ